MNVFEQAFQIRTFHKATRQARFDDGAWRLGVFAAVGCVVVGCVGCSAGEQPSPNSSSATTAASGNGTADGSTGSMANSSGGGFGVATGVGGSGATMGSGGGTAGNAGSTSTSDGSPDSHPIPVDELPIIEELPDPLTMSNGTKVTTVEQWSVRRQEMIRILEDYTYGHMPPAPDNMSARTVAPARDITTRSGVSALYSRLHLTFGPDEQLGFDLGMFVPESPPAGGNPGGAYPVIVSLAFNADEGSVGGAAGALSRGYAVATIPYQQLGADSPRYRSTGFFPAYPEYDWRDFSAWAWGISRAIDYLVTDPAIDPDKIIITGVSRLGQAVLVAGAFDERVALSAPVAGGMAFRFSGAEKGGGLGQGITEIVDQNTYWFGPLFEEFRNQTDKLPSDQHWLPALTAPRLFIMCNSLNDPYGRAYAAVQSYLGAKPVYDFLGFPDNLGLYFRPGGHGATAEDWSAIFDFSDQYLLGKAETRRFDVIPPDEQLP